VTQDTPIPDPTPGPAAGADPSSTFSDGLPHHPRSPFFCLRNILWTTFFLALTLAMRCANYLNVFYTPPQGGPREIYFPDGDCYARMTRVRDILSHWHIIHYHAWENFPSGTFPHTTAPFDFLIAAIALVLKPFTTDYIDMAGAIVSPILGLLTTAFLALWARELHQQYRRLMLLLVSLSPILVHGTALGRPDHQSLQIFLVAVGIGAELIMARAPRVSWSIVSGAAWGLALWVSLYEPLVIVAIIFLTKLIFYRPSLFVKERIPGLLVMAAILAFAWFIDGPWLYKSFQIEAHDQTLRNYFSNWSSSIEEMKSASSLGVNPDGSTVFWEFLHRWVGFGLLASPLLLIARLRDTKRSLLLLTLLTVTFILTMFEIRWGYFFALIFAMSLPWQLSLFRRKWLVWTLFLLSLWPLAREWDIVLFDPGFRALQDANIGQQRHLRAVALLIKEHAPGGIIAPWWWSPQLSYWSGQPAVAGSSHESLAGIVDTARFFSTTDPKVAQAICDTRYIETVVTGLPGNIVQESVHILGQPLPLADNTMADILWEKPHSVPPFLHVIINDNNSMVKVFEVNHGSITYK
jgi:hypothetical protein